MKFPLNCGQPHGHHLQPAPGSLAIFCCLTLAQHHVAAALERGDVVALVIHEAWNGAPRRLEAYSLRRLTGKGSEEGTPL